MEASRRSQNAYAACGSQPEHSHHQEIIKPALDFHFQDVEGLLQLVRVAMEVISTWSRVGWQQIKWIYQLLIACLLIILDVGDLQTNGGLVFVQVYSIS